MIVISCSKIFDYYQEIEILNKTTMKNDDLKKQIKLLVNKFAKDTKLNCLLYFQLFEFIAGLKNYDFQEDFVDFLLIEIETIINNIQGKDNVNTILSLCAMIQFLKDNFIIKFGINKYFDTLISFINCLKNMIQRNNCKELNVLLLNICSNLYLSLNQNKELQKTKKERFMALLEEIYLN